LGTALLLPLALPLSGCNLSEAFGGGHKYTLSPRGDRLVRWIQHEGHDVMMAPEALAVMGLNNGGRDVPVMQLAFWGEGADKDSRYVVSLVNIRQIHEFVFHRRQGDLLIFHHADTRFARLGSVRYPRNGKPTFITDNALAENDFSQQMAFWFDHMPGR
jgi:hypothetical protein